jgi:hypothetical protein
MNILAIEHLLLSWVLPLRPDHVLTIVLRPLDGVELLHLLGIGIMLAQAQELLDGLTFSGCLGLLLLTLLCTLLSTHFNNINKVVEPSLCIP